MSTKHVAINPRSSYNKGSKNDMAHVEGAPKREHRPIENTPQQQLGKFLGTWKTSLELKGKRDPIELQKDHDYLEKFYLAFLSERISRSEEMSSPEISSAVRIAIEMMGSRPGVISCMDGRIPLPVIAGLPMTSAKGLRLPGGDTPGFKHNPTDGHLELDPKSQLGKMLSENRSNGDEIKFEIFISHSHCAARKRLVGFTGRDPADNGLFDDTFDKSLQGEVLNRDYGISAINFTYNPETGYGIMGLSKNTVLQEVRQNHGSLYTDGVMDLLVEDAKVVSTKKIAEEFQAEFEKRYFAINWTDSYKDSALRFWNNMQMMGETVLPQIKKTVMAIYPDRHEDEIRMRSVFLLANAYSGWLHNPTGNEHPFKTHNEACVVVDYKTKGPFKLAAFIVTPIEGSTPENVLLAQSIVRQNRTSGNTVDITNTYIDDSFIQATVPVVYKGEVDINSSDTHFWNQVRELDWSEVALTWENTDFEEWLKRQVGAEISQNHFDSLIKVVRKLKSDLTEMRTDPYIQYLLDGGYLTVLPLLVSDDRKPQTIVNMVA